MGLTLRPFGRADLAEYAGWFRDDLLDAQLGPIDPYWHPHQEPEGCQLCAELEGELVCVLGVLYFLEEDPPHYLLTGIATRPSLRGQGIGSLALLAAMAQHRAEAAWRAVVHVDNTRSHAMFARLGFRPTSEVADEDGYRPWEVSAEERLRRPSPGTA